jgi:hypothetical protein
MGSSEVGFSEVGFSEVGFSEVGFSGFGASVGVPLSAAGLDGSPAESVSSPGSPPSAAGSSSLPASSAEFGSEELPGQAAKSRHQLNHKTRCVRSTDMAFS